MLEKDVVAEFRSAIKAGDLKTLRDLITQYPKSISYMSPFGTWLHDALKFRQYEIAKWLIAEGADVNAVGGIVATSPLNIAARDGDLAIVKLLVANKARFDLSAPETNPIFAAVYGDHGEIVKYLIDCGVDPHIKYNGRDARQFAKEWGRQSALRILDPNDRDQGKEQPEERKLDDAPFDLARLRQGIALATTKAWHNCKAITNSPICGFCLYTNHDVDFIICSVNTERAHATAVLELKNDPARLQWLNSVNLTLSEAIDDLKWNPFEWNYSDASSFTEVNGLIAARRHELLASPDEIEGLRFRGLVFAAMVLTLRDLTGHGQLSPCPSKDGTIFFCSVFDSPYAEWLERDSMNRLNERRPSALISRHIRHRHVSVLDDIAHTEYITIMESSEIPDIEHPTDSDD